MKIILMLMLLVLCAACSKNNAKEPKEYVRDQSVTHPFKYKLGQTVKVNEPNSIFSNCKGTIIGGYDLENGPFYFVELHTCPAIKGKFRHTMQGGEEFFVSGK